MSTGDALGSTVYALEPSEAIELATALADAVAELKFSLASRDAGADDHLTTL